MSDSLWEVTSESSPESAFHIRSVQGLCLIAALLVFGASLLHFINVTYDDAFISFRYARNLAQGDGLVFNPGEAVEGYSNFLWTVLMSVPLALGWGSTPIGLLAIAKLVGALLCFATLFLVIRMARRPLGSVSGGIFAVLWLAATPQFALWGVGALETPLLAFLLTGGVFSFCLEQERAPHRLPLSSVLMGAAALTRPEPILLGGVLFLFLLWPARHAGIARRRAFLWAAPFALIVSAFLAFRLSYYGEFFPNTYYAKLHQNGIAMARGSSYLGRAESALNLLGIAAVCSLILLLSRHWSRTLSICLALLGTHLIGIVYEGGDWMPASRLLVPALPLVALVLAETWAAASSLKLSSFTSSRQLPAWVLWPEHRHRYEQRIRHLASSKSGLWLLPLLPLVARLSLILVSAYGVSQSWSTITLGPGISGRHGWNPTRYLHHEPANFMKNELEPGLLAIGEAGYLPYVTQQPVLDLFGLNDRHIARQPGAMHKKFDLQYVLSRKPEYVFLVMKRDDEGNAAPIHEHGRILLGSSEFSKDYEVLQKWPGSELYQRSSHEAKP